MKTLGEFKEKRKKGNPEDIIEKMRGNISVTLVRGIQNPEDKDKDKSKMPANPATQAAEKKIAPDAFKVTFKSTSPAMAALVANQLATMFVEESVRSREGHSEGPPQFLQPHLHAPHNHLAPQQHTTPNS